MLQQFNFLIFKQNLHVVCVKWKVGDFIPDPVLFVMWLNSCVSGHPTK